MSKKRCSHRVIEGLERCQRQREVYAVTFDDDGYTPVGFKWTKQVCNRRPVFCGCSVCGKELEHTDTPIIRICSGCFTAPVGGGRSHTMEKA